MKHIFVIDDDTNIRQLILRYLEKEGYKVTALIKSCFKEQDFLKD